MAKAAAAVCTAWAEHPVVEEGSLSVEMDRLTARTLKAEAELNAER